MGLNIALKIAIHESGLRQGFIAEKAGMSDTQLSHVVNGRRDATEDQKKVIAKILHKKVHELFSEVAA